MHANEPGYICSSHTLHFALWTWGIFFMLVVKFWLANLSVHFIKMFSVKALFTNMLHFGKQLVWDSCPNTQRLPADPVQ